MLTITLHDLRFRARQFVIAVVGAGLVFAMTLLLSGMAAGFSVEINQTVQAMGAQSWVLAAGSVGSGRGAVPHPGVGRLSSGARPRCAPGRPRDRRPPGRRDQRPPGTECEPHRLPPRWTRGAGQRNHRAERGGNGQAVVDARMKLGVGQIFEVSGHGFRVVGVVADRTLLGGVPNAYVTLADAQAVVFGGRALIGGVLTTGVPTTVPAGYGVYTNAQVEQASLAQLASAVSSINNSKFFMWVIAAIIVAALVYVTALERTRDFAVLKALGSSTRLLFVGLAAQAVAVALAAAVIAAILSNFMTGIFAQPVDIPGNAFIVLPLSALVVGLLASLAALRRAASVDPAAAFAGA